MLNSGIPPELQRYLWARDQAETALSLALPRLQQAQAEVQRLQPVLQRLATETARMAQIIEQDLSAAEDGDHHAVRRLAFYLAPGLPEDSPFEIVVEAMRQLIAYRHARIAVITEELLLGHVPGGGRVRWIIRELPRAVEDLLSGRGYQPRVSWTTTIQPRVERRGRLKDSTRIHPSEIPRKYRDAYRQAEVTASYHDEPVTQDQVAYLMGINVRTLLNYLRRTDLNLKWPPKT